MVLNLHFRLRDDCRPGAYGRDFPLPLFATRPSGEARSNSHMQFAGELSKLSAPDDSNQEEGEAENAATPFAGTGLTPPIPRQSRRTWCCRRPPIIDT